MHWRSRCKKELFGGKENRNQFVWPKVRRNCVLCHTLVRTCANRSICVDFSRFAFSRRIVKKKRGKSLKFNRTNTHHISSTWFARYTPEKHHHSIWPGGRRQTKVISRTQFTINRSTNHNPKWGYFHRDLPLACIKCSTFIHNSTHRRCQSSNLLILVSLQKQNKKLIQ